MDGRESRGANLGIRNGTGSVACCHVCGLGSHEGQLRRLPRNPLRVGALCETSPVPPFGRGGALDSPVPGAHGGSRTLRTLHKRPLQSMPTITLVRGRHPLSRKPTGRIQLLELYPRQAIAIDPNTDQEENHDRCTDS